MQKRMLGRSGLEVSAIGFGCMGLNYHRGIAPDRREMIMLVREAVELGVTFFDTAEAYGPFTNESLVGEALEPFKGQVIIATKFGHDVSGIGAADGLDSRPERIRQVADNSLKRLRVDAIDLFYQHRVDPRVPIEDVAGTVRDLIAAGKVRHFGLSEAATTPSGARTRSSPLRPSRANTRSGGASPKRRCCRLCEELGIGFVPYSPLGRGFLAGSIDETTKFVGSDNRGSLPRFSPEARKANRPLVTLLEDTGRQKRATAAQVALAWLLAQQPWIVPIPGTTKLTRLEENIHAASLELTPQDLNDLEDAASRITIQGGRYPQALEELSGR